MREGCFGEQKKKNKEKDKERKSINRIHIDMKFWLLIIVDRHANSTSRALSLLNY
jgi:hypothetical protein